MYGLPRLAEGSPRNDGGEEMSEFKHIPVLLAEVIEGLNIKENGLYVDGTIGGAGHTIEICRRGGMIIGIDRDEEALKVARERLKKFDIELVHSNFMNIKEILGDRKIDGAILDLGVSSYQLDEAERGFSYHNEAKLDMRMDKSQELTAEIVVNTYEESELSRILKEYGEERYARQIARNIIKNRPIKTTIKLVEVIKRSIPAKVRFADKHPAKRTFQAIRIEVNGELDSIKYAIKDFADCLNAGGRLVIITFHSLEDRIVKEEFNNLANPKCVCPPSLPICGCGADKSNFRLITKKPIIPSEKEIKENIRSHSAKLRIIERV